MASCRTDSQTLCPPDTLPKRDAFLAEMEAYAEERGIPMIGRAVGRT
jgi:hypothetical protein